MKTVMCKDRGELVASHCTRGKKMMHSGLRRSVRSCGFHSGSSFFLWPCRRSRAPIPLPWARLQSGLNPQPSAVLTLGPRSCRGWERGPSEWRKDVAEHAQPDVLWGFFAGAVLPAEHTVTVFLRELSCLLPKAIFLFLALNPDLTLSPGSVPTVQTTGGAVASPFVSKVPGYTQLSDTPVGPSP